MQDDLFTAAIAAQANSSHARFHPVVQAWFNESLGAPTEIQARSWPLVQGQKNVLVAAPTGSGKTLAAFLAAINDLTERSIQQPLNDQVYVLYVSPLKALSNDIEKNLQWPLSGIRQSLDENGIAGGSIRCAVRTGDTPQAERTRMRKLPPHILVTTPESLFILLTSESGRAMLGAVETVIVDEVHSMAANKRGAHLALSLERLDALVGKPVVRIGLSATQKPIELTARFLVGGTNRACEIVDVGHIRERDIALELPESPLDAVMANEVWGELYDRLAQLVTAHRQTLIFVNTRRLAERLARHLEERIGEDRVMAHHGSLSREHRLKAETRLKSGDLPVLVATASLELGIDIGDIDLVCQMGSPRSIAAFLQRVGRSGHGIGMLPKGRLFPLALDDLVECAALIDAVNRGELDQLILPKPALDVLAQQIVAECASREWGTDALFAQITNAAPYADLSREQFDQVITMLAMGVATTHGRRGAHLHFDAVNGIVRGRRGARLSAMTQAGVIPDQFDYDVVLMPDGHRIGTLSEDFAFESLPGDIFQLGNTEYQVLKVESSRVLVADAAGQPPTVPFWFGEAPGRTDALSFAVSRLRKTAAEKLSVSAPACEQWLREELKASELAAAQITEYLAAAHAALGDLPTLDNLILERFFDDAGDTHLVLHSSYGSRVNRAFGLALRKRFCRQFNFELQASALEDSLILSLGPTHSFELETVAGFLRSHNVREVLIQALLDAPMFLTRWRWNATIALAVQKMRSGNKMPPPIQRAQAEDLMAVVFPDQLACQENLSGEREVPDHPLVDQTIRDCLHDTMDVEGLERLVQRIEQGEIKVIACDLTGPSPLSSPIINARPYAFLDDGDAEGRRTRAISSAAPTDIAAAAESAQLTVEAIERVVAEVRPEPRDADELHDALMTSGFLVDHELGLSGQIEDLEGSGRAFSVAISDTVTIWAATERAQQFQALFPNERIPEPPAQWLVPDCDATSALQAIVASRLEISGPIELVALAKLMGISEEKLAAGLMALEATGAIMQGRFHPSATETQWCDRRLLQRIHRYSRQQKRDSIRAVSPAAYMRFLLSWHQISEDRRQGEEGLAAALTQLEGYPVATSVWASELLRPRVVAFQTSQLDALCLAGRQLWLPALSKEPEEARVSVVKSSAIIFCPREHRRQWLTRQASEEKLGSRALRVLEFFRQRGAVFFDDLTDELGMPATEIEKALTELVANAWVSADSFSALSTLIAPTKRKKRGRAPLSMSQPGRWSLLGQPQKSPEQHWSEDDVEVRARVLLRRYGVVFRGLLKRENSMPPWRDLLYCFRRLEARGEIRGGRFVSGFSGEQFALADAARRLSGFRNEPENEPPLLVLSTCDPLNLSGTLPGTERIPAVAGHQMLMRGDQVVAVQDSQGYRSLIEVSDEEQWQYQSAMIRHSQSGRMLPDISVAH